MLSLIGLVVLAGGIAVSGWLLAMFLMFARRSDSLVEAMVHLAFLPEKRSRYLSLLSVEGCLFLLAALTWGLTQVGVLPESIAVMLLPLFFLGGMTSVAGLTWIGLRPVTLSAADRARIAARGPGILYSLAMAPLAEGMADDRR
jgi:hypothetical protein